MSRGSISWQAAFTIGCLIAIGLYILGRIHG